MSDDLPAAYLHLTLLVASRVFPFSESTRTAGDAAAPCVQRRAGSHVIVCLMASQTWNPGPQVARKTVLKPRTLTIPDPKVPTANHKL